MSSNHVVITKFIFGITLLSVGRILYYITNENSDEHGFFNGFKSGLLKTDFKVERRENGKIVKNIKNFLKWVEKHENDLEDFSKECKNSEIVENVGFGDHDVFKSFKKSLGYFLKWFEKGKNGENFFISFKRSLRNFLRWVEEHKNVVDYGLGDFSKWVEEHENREIFFNGLRDLLKWIEGYENGENDIDVKMQY
ncbi:hypothetical protein Glove_168g261 [Diversispora epigaea]|uniref:Uncharacterized protein n=1 Tax=Diversispora epigaea TaxID=1348612 RepID=A0A397IYD5_9GLOM|nr:hypothetical protein Glove_168g261 [Diversispora epigaea]